MIKQAIGLDLYADYDMAVAYVKTTPRFKNCELQLIRDIYGVIAVETSRSGIQLCFGRAFDYNELLAKSLQAILELLGITVAQADFYIDKGMSLQIDRDEKRLQDVIALIQSKQTPRLRNPIATFAATRHDIRPGVELMVVSYKEFDIVDVFTVAGYPQRIEHGVLHNSYKLPTLSPEFKKGHRYLTDMGVVPYSNGSHWNPIYLTIVNTAENRRKLVWWLCQRGKTKVAEKVVNQYIDDFVKEAKITLEHYPLRVVAQFTM